jgi:hypothetical protein
MDNAIECSQLPHVAESDVWQQLGQARDKWDRTAIQHQRLRAHFGLMTVLLGPASVLLLAVQICWFADRVSVGSALILAEVVALAATLVVGALPTAASHEQWIRARLRAELIRREQFLLLARVGPYLHVEDAAVPTAVERRLRELDGDELDPMELVPLEDAAHGRWLDALEDGDPGRPRQAASSADDTGHPDLRDAMRLYLRDRLRHQRDHFSRRSAEHTRSDHWYDFGAKAVLTFALVMAAVHLGMLVTSAHGAPYVRATVETAALVLPSLGAMLVALRSLFAHPHLSRSYAEQARALARLESDFTDREEAVVRGASVEDTRLRFKRLVLRTEERLASELCQWWLIIHPEQPKGGC